MNTRKGRDNHFRAVCKKIKVVRPKEKFKLVLKLMLRVVGVKKPLFLGGYYREEDDRQRKWDAEIYCRLQWAKTDEVIAESHKGGHTPNVIEEVAAQKKQLLTLLKERESYLALAVESLDKGGLEEVVRLLAVELRNHEIPVKLFCMQSGGEIAEDLQAKGFQVLIFDGDRDALEQYCKEHPPLLVNSHYGLEQLEVFHQLGIPVVEVIHNMYVFLNRDGISIEQKKMQCISQYIAVSEKAKEIYLGKFPIVSPKKVTVIGNALGSVKAVDKSREEVRASLGIDEDAFVYIVVGSIDARKNQIGILRAWDILSQMADEKIALVIAGGGTDYEYEKKVHQLVKERVLHKNVVFTGHTKDIYNLLNAADVFVLNSYYEGWSIAATEALSCGLPLIHADCGSGRELTAEGRNGILIDHPLQDVVSYNSAMLYDVMHAGINENVEQLVVAMLTMLEQKEYWMGQRDAIRQYAIENFSSSKVLGQYLKVFWDVCEREKPIVQNGAKTDE